MGLFPNPKRRSTFATTLWTSGGLEPLEVRAFLSASLTSSTTAADCATAISGESVTVASVSVTAAHATPATAKAAVMSLKAQALAQALASESTNPQGATALPENAAAIAAQTAAAEAGATGTATTTTRKRRARPHAIRKPQTTPTPTTPQVTPATIAAAVFVDPARAEKPSMGFDLSVTTTVPEWIESAVSESSPSAAAALVLSPPAVSHRPVLAVAAVDTVEQVPRRLQASFGGVPRFSDTPIAALVTHGREAAASLLSVAAGTLPDWLTVGPLSGYRFSDSELMFKAGGMVLGIAGFTAGYCGYLNTTRRRRRAAADARMEIYSMLGWQEAV